MTLPKDGMLCPLCRVTLMMTHRQGIEIDYCPQCRGIWLDRGELDKLVERQIMALQAIPGDAAVPPPPPPRAAERTWDDYSAGRQPPHERAYPDERRGRDDDDDDDRRRGGRRPRSFLAELFDFD